MTVYRLAEATPALSDDCWIATGAHVIGKVIIGAGVGIWFGATLRGDNEPVTVGDGTNIQEHTVCHTDMGLRELPFPNRVLGPNPEQAS